MLGIWALIVFLVSGPIFAASAYGSQMPTGTLAAANSSASATPSIAPTPTASGEPSAREHDGMMGLTTSELIALLAAGASTVIGLLALMVSLRANRTSASALQLAERAYLAESRLSVTSSAEKDCLVLAPERADQTINTITLFFPRKIGIAPIALATGDLRLSFDRISSALQRYWDSRTPVIPGRAALREHVPIPVVALVHGHTKGDAAITVGYYDLYSQYIRNQNGSSLITIKSLTLNNFGVPGDNPQAAADRILGEIESFMDAQPATLGGRE